MATLLTGSALAQAISLIALPFVTRLYTPADLGVLAFFAAACLLAGQAVCGRFELAVPLPEADDEARDVLRLATVTGLALAGAAALAMGLAGSTVGGDPVRRWIVWVPASLALTALYQPLSYWFTRKARFRAIALTRIAQSAGAASLQVALGLAGLAGPGALVAGALVGQAAATVALESAIAKAGAPPLAFRVAPARGSLALARRYSGFPLFSTGAGLLQIAADQLPLLVFPFLFGVAEAGVFALSARLVQAAVALLASSAGQAFYPRAARAEGEGRLAAESVTLYRVLIRWTVGPALVAAWIAPALFARVFGPEWEASGAYFRRMVPWFVAALPFAAMSQLFLVRERQRLQMVWNALVVATAVGALALSRAGLSPLATIASLSAGVAVVRLLAVESALRVAGARAGESVGAALRELRWAIAPVGPLALASALRAGTDVRLGLGVGLVGLQLGVLLGAARREGRGA